MGLLLGQDRYSGVHKQQRGTRGITLFFKSYNIYSGVADDMQKKKVLGVFTGSFQSSLVRGDHSF